MKNPGSNRDEEGGPAATATSRASDETGEEDEVERLHMYVMIFNPQLALVAKLSKNGQKLSK